MGSNRNDTSTVLNTVDHNKLVIHYYIKVNCISIGTAGLRLNKLPSNRTEVYNILLPCHYCRSNDLQTHIYTVLLYKDCEVLSNTKNVVNIMIKQ